MSLGISKSVNQGNTDARKVKRSKYRKYLEFQNFQCSICRVPLVGGKDSHWDHCHKTGQFRAWLCRACNWGLGHFKDNPKFLRQAANYIELHEAAHAF